MSENLEQKYIKIEHIKEEDVSTEWHSAETMLAKPVGKKEIKTEDNCAEIDIGPIQVELDRPTKCLSRSSVKQRQKQKGAPGMKNNIVGKQNNQCPYCPRHFEMRYELQIHLRIHTDNLPYKCQQCPISFAHIANYRAHMRAHKDRCPYKCPHCPNAYDQYSHYLLHMRTHAVSLQCPHCPRIFFKHCSFMRHFNAHNNNKREFLRYKCSHCPETFTQLSRCKAHMRKHDIQAS
ncbi:zinc finger protein 564-like [Drosophila montana]|uniref:zinc finger protein 564-like n=1 Tax=Drosophila montana TaxID=40370 RepID=UPI00313D0A8B